MNQILMTDVENKGKNTNMKSIIRFFCIVCIVFSVILIGEGGFNLYKSLGKNSSTNNSEKSDTSYKKAETPENNEAKPNFKFQKNGSSLNLMFDSTVGINKVIYSWNGGNETVVKVDGKKEVNFDIEIPQGNNNLSLSVIDANGEKTKFKDQNISFEEVADSQKPVISIKNENGRLYVTAKDETELDYFSYQWEGSDEVVVNPSEEDKTTVEQEIEVQKGTSRLTLTAVDKTGNKESTTKKIIGSNGPSISASISEGNFVVKVTDEFGITKIEYTHNEEVFNVDNIPEGATEFEFKVPLKDGANYLKINAYENGIMTEYKCKKTK